MCAHDQIRGKENLSPNLKLASGTDSFRKVSLDSKHHQTLDLKAAILMLILRGRSIN